MSKVVIFAAGGSGGHLIPAQIVARELLAAESSARVQFLGSHLSACPFFDAEKFGFIDIPSGTFNWRHPLRSLKGAWNLLKGLWLSLQFFAQMKPHLVVGFGSYHSLPVVAAAYLKKIPIVLLESNIIPGQVNRFFAKYSKAVLVPYSECRKHLKDPIVQVKMPLRQLKDDSEGTRERAAEYLGLDAKKKTLVILGGSQGARALNALVTDALEHLADRGYKFQVIHLCGQAAHVRTFEHAYARMKVPHVVKGFESSMQHVWAMADLAICRIGAMTLAELIEFEVPAIVIPFPYAKDNHQDRNADFFVEHVAGGIKLKEELASPEKLLTLLLELLTHKGKNLEEYRKHLKEFKVSMPTKSMTSYLLECL